MKSDQNLQVTYNISTQTIFIHGDAQYKKSFLENCIRSGLKFGLHLIIMKMIITCPTIASALSTSPNFLNGGLEIIGDEGLYKQIKGVVDQINTSHQNATVKTENKTNNLGFNLGFNEGLVLLGTSALTAFITGLGLNYLNSAIKEYKPNPLYVYGAFMAMLASIYAMGSVPIVVPNIAALSTTYLLDRYLNPHIANLNEGGIKTTSNFISSILPVLASGVAALTLYPTFEKAVITTAGLLLGSKAAQYSYSWLEKVKNPHHSPAFTCFDVN